MTNTELKPHRANNKWECKGSKSVFDMQKSFETLNLTIPNWSVGNQLSIQLTYSSFSFNVDYAIQIINFNLLFFYIFKRTHVRRVHLF